MKDKKTELIAKEVLQNEINALKNLNTTRISNEQRDKLYINKGRMLE